MQLQGIVLKYQVLDNEISAAYKAKILSSDITYDHHRNIAEKSIQTWKEHFVGVLSVPAVTFIMHLWCQAIPHAKQHILLLRRSNVNPKISA